MLQLGFSQRCPRVPHQRIIPRLQVRDFSWPDDMISNSRASLCMHLIHNARKLV